jgi:L-malate glycosyltransferase
MKILLAGPFLTSGLRSLTGLDFEGAAEGHAQTPLVPLAAELHKRGHEVHVLSLDARLNRVESYEDGGIRLTYAPVRAPPRYRTRVRALDLFKVEIANLVEVMRASDADIIHAHWTYEFAEAAVRAGKPYLVTMHDLGWDYLFIFRDAYRFMRLVMKYRVMPRVKWLTVVAPFQAKKARQYLFRGDVRVVANGIDVPSFDPEVPQRKADRAPKLVTIGNDGRVKNVRKSVEAFRLIKNRIPEAELHLFGPGLGQDYARGERGIVAHDNTNHPELMRFLEEEGTLLVHPSLIEACPVIILEAKARGLPVVAGRDSGGVPFTCGDNAGCSLVNVKSAEKIAQAVLPYLTDREHYRRSAIAAREDAAHRFSNEAICDQYEDAYRSILETGRL